MPKLNRPMDEWPYSNLVSRARLLCLLLDPSSPKLPAYRTQVLYWHELRELLTEIDRRGLQGKLL